MRAVLAIVLGIATLMSNPRPAGAGGADFVPEVGPQTGDFADSIPVVESTAKPWDRYQAALALNLGTFSAVGTLGLTGSFLPGSHFETEIGIGVGESGLQLSAMQKLLFGSAETKRFVVGAGLSYGGGNRDFPDSTIWLNLDLAGMEIRTARGFYFFFAGGLFTALAGGRYITPMSNDCGKPYCGNAVGEIYPQGRMGIGFWLF
jgi:hypothetical protein